MKLTFVSQLTKILSRSFGADIRSIACFRICLGILLLLDLAIRVLSLKAHYSDAGVLPRASQFRLASPAIMSLHFVSGLVWVQALLFFFAALAAIALIAGYRTRWAIVASWILLISINSRNTIITYGQDAILRCITFWALFLPLNGRFSVDAAKDPTLKENSQWIISGGTVAIVLQLAIIYFFAGLLKNSPEWRETHTAIFLTLEADQYVTSIGQFFTNYPEFLKLLTRSVMWLELFGPILFFSPVCTSLARIIGIVLFSCLQLGFALCLDLGMFPLVSSLFLIILLPSCVWDTTLRYMRNAQFLFPSLSRVINSCKTNIHAIFQFFSLSIRHVSPSRVLQTRNDLYKHILPGALLIYVIFWNIGTLPKWKFSWPTGLKQIAYILRIDQNWSLFAPGPPRYGFWFIIPGHLENGREIDLMKTLEDFTTAPDISWERPQKPLDTFRSKRWRRYLTNLSDKNFKNGRQPFGEYLCREWNALHKEGEQLISLEVVMLKEASRIDWQRPVAKKAVVMKYECGNKTQIVAKP